MFSASKEEEKMSSSDEVEDMDTSPVPPPSSDEPSETSKTSSQDEEGIQLVLSVKWIENVHPQKLEFEMERLLQVWFNIRKSGTTCSVVKISEDGRVLISLKPPPAPLELQQLNGETLSSKSGHTVKIMSVSPTSELETQIPQKASMNHPSISEPQHESVQQREPRHLGSSAAVSTAGVETCSLPTSKTSSQDEEGIQLVLSVKWIENAPPQKVESEMQRLLQSWFNIRKSGTTCSVVKISEDGHVLISLKPAPAPVELQKLNGETLSSKRGHTVEITSVSLMSELETQIPQKASMNHPSISEPQHESMQQREPRHLGSSAAVSTAGVETCSLPVSDFWYLSHVYQEEINCIEKENGVKITAEVKVTLSPEQDGDPHTALSKFTDLVQTCLNKSNASIIPLKCVDPEEWKDALKIIQKTENKLLLTLSPGHMTIFGPSQSQAAFSKSLNAAWKTFPNTSTTFRESAWASQDAPLKIGMNINDPLVNDGITMEQNHWRLMTTSYSQHVADIKAKFGVDFKESDNGQGKVTVKACYNRSEGNVLMESHAVRAFLNLFQRFTTTPMSLTQQYGASGFTDPSKNLNNNYQSEGASSGLVFNGRSIHNEEGATAGGSEDDNCPICMDKFTNKKQLKCKHEFCEECLKQAVSSMGPICPVCKDVFGPIEGDQPDGKMSWKSIRYSLPGFPGYGTIEIDYNIPSGIQMEKHPKPGRSYYGISRKAYLPDNKEGNDVLRLLKKAFDQKLIFTIGMSRTTGLDNQVTWNDIHHKTSIAGGPENFGYPDPGYLSRVREELKAKGIK